MSIPTIRARVHFCSLDRESERPTPPACPVTHSIAAPSPLSGTCGLWTLMRCACCASVNFTPIVIYRIYLGAAAAGVCLQLKEKSPAVAGRGLSVFRMLLGFRGPQIISRIS